ncbi:MAG: hypothetical protein HUU32_04545 [Calditrichaceae bacterium]|nr:hypothetical protein [Calditrichia bacterium]NUQ40644.1 hypothetical protein [Calditrichaceae bacterium]
MGKTKPFGKKNILLLVLAAGIAGAVLFFPVNINNQYTCLYHRLFSPGHSYTHSTGDDISQTQKEDLLNRYLSPFGLLWWGSLLITALSIYGLRRQAPGNANKPPVNPPALSNHIET